MSRCPTKTDRPQPSKQRTTRSWSCPWNRVGFPSCGIEGLQSAPKGALPTEAVATRTLRTCPRVSCNRDPPAGDRLLCVSGDDTPEETFPAGPRQALGTPRIPTCGDRVTPECCTGGARPRQQALTGSLWQAANGVSRAGRRRGGRERGSPHSHPKIRHFRQDTGKAGASRCRGEGSAGSARHSPGHPDCSTDSDSCCKHQHLPAATCKEHPVFHKIQQIVFLGIQQWHSSNLTR